MVIVFFNQQKAEVVPFQGVRKYLCFSSHGTLFQIRKYAVSLFCFFAPETKLPQRISKRRHVYFSWIAFFNRAFETFEHKNTRKKQVTIYLIAFASVMRNLRQLSCWLPCLWHPHFSRSPFLTCMQNNAGCCWRHLCDRQLLWISEQVSVVFWPLFHIHSA